MTVNVPDSFCELLDEGANPDREVSTRLAAHFYSAGKVGLSRAASMAGMERWKFERWLREHGVELPWNEADLAHEVAAAKHLSEGTCGS